MTQYDCSLREALAERVDGQRRAVLVLGAGLHSQLLGMAGATDAEWAGAAAFCRWVRLLEQMARHVGAPLARHDSFTATWEGLILARKMASPRDEPAHKHEEALFKELVEHLSATRHPLFAAGAARAAAQERCRLFFGDYRDVVTLNMDLTISRLLGAEPRPMQGMCFIYDASGRLKSVTISFLKFAFCMEGEPESYQSVLR